MPDRLAESESSDLDRFEALYREHRRAVLQYLAHKTNDRYVADDLTEVTFEFAWQRIAVVPPGPNAKAWLIAVARRQLSNYWRSRTRRLRLIQRVASAETSDAPSVHSQDDYTIVTAALQHLSPHHQEVLRLIYWHGLSNAEGAESQHCSINAFTIRLHRARAALAKEYGMTVKHDSLNPLDTISRRVVRDRGETRSYRETVTVARGNHRVSTTHPSRSDSALVIWLTGLSGAGKSTIARLIERQLLVGGIHACVLDGDDLRLGLNRDLGFTVGERAENVRRVAEVARLFAMSGVTAVVALISPLECFRRLARTIVGSERFYEVFVDVPLAVAEARDPKGLYAKARGGELPGFTGIDSPYEPPRNPQIRVDGTRMSAVDAANHVLRSITTAHRLPQHIRTEAR